MIVYENKIAIDINGTIDEVYYTVTDLIDKKPFPMLDEKYSTMEDAVADLKEKEGEVIDYLEKKDYTESTETDDEIRESHPAYCTVGFFKSQRGLGGTALFNSSIKHNNTITLSISEADIERSLHTDWIHPTRKIIEVEMSHSQFADLLTSFNQGEGVPATIRWRENRGMIPSPKFVSKKQQFSKEFAQKTKGTEQVIAAIESEFEELLANKKIPKKDKERIEDLLSKLRFDNGTNMRFLETSWQEQIDKTSSEAKREIEAFWDQKLHNIAIEAIGKSNFGDQLSNNETPIALEEI